jgi:hypothetical protein
MSSIPGNTHLPDASITCGQPASSISSAVIAATCPSLMAMLRTAEGAPVPSNQRPLRMIVS